MHSVLFQTTTQLENKLSGLYEVLYKKKSKIAKNINQFAKSKKNHSVKQALFLHLSFNTGLISTLFYLLY